MFHVNPLLAEDQRSHVKHQALFSLKKKKKKKNNKKYSRLSSAGGWSGGAMVLGKLPVPGRPQFG